MQKIINHQVKGKRILLRVDLNCPLNDGKITSSTRIQAHSKTISELAARGARVIVLAHQGRFGGDDFISLEQHARILRDAIGRNVHFVDDVIGDRAKHAISKLQDGDVLVLENVRSLSCETDHPDGEGEIVSNLAPFADYFVLDALSIAHRKHSSIVGFTSRMPSFAGDVLASEIEAVDKVRHAKDVTFIFGGSKVEDSFAVMKKWLAEGRAKYILVGGALSVLLLYASGRSVGGSREYLKNAKLDAYVPEAKDLLQKYSDKIVLPLDVGLSIKMVRSESDSSTISHGEIWDIGEKTIAHFSDIISHSSVIVMNGPMGVYELDDFSKGTKAMLDAVARCDAFSLIGGGHTISAIEKFNIDKKYFGYVSLSGKALIEYLCGKSLPGVVSLDTSAKKFSSGKSHGV
ncbi:phosphoglycerate kinase [Candidatus Micrarchaeota archaeon]|nr:phosphoglycerate kinase [Candidatus Micrarchaeota archaeon]